MRESRRALGSISIFFGIAAWTKESDNAGVSMLKSADAALYRAKREGRNRVIIEGREAA